MLLDDRGQLKKHYATALLENIVPFWLDHCLDQEYGGHFTCLDRQGQVYDTVKSIWMQGRHAWMFSELYNEIEHRPEYLKAAALAARFLADHARDENGDWYLLLDRMGKPLETKSNFFAGCFAALGLGEYSCASGESWARDLAVETFERLVEQARRQEYELGDQGPDDPSMRAMSVPMILVNLADEFGGATGYPAAQIVKENIDKIMTYHIAPKADFIYERVGADGSHPDNADGRLINPGHGIEGMWFIMWVANKQGKQELILRAAEALEGQLALGWDEEYGGLYQFLDIGEGKPPLRADWKEKHWWPHCEALVATLLGWHLTGRKSLAQWHERIHEYTWSHFPDCEHGEWYAALSREGKPMSTLKGSYWKGCFHIPRALLFAMKILGNDFISVSYSQSRNGVG